jgi:hypothetical protein
VEIRTEAAQFPGKEYINGIFLAVHDVSIYNQEEPRTPASKLWTKMAREASQSETIRESKYNIDNTGAAYIIIVLYV